MELIIWGFESHSIGLQGLGAASRLSDIARNLSDYQWSRRWWIHWSDCSSYDKSCLGLQLQLQNLLLLKHLYEWRTTTSVSGNDRFRDGAFPPTFFGAVAAEMLLRFRPP